LHNIAVSGLSKLRSNADELRRSWATALSSLCFFSTAAFSVLAVTGQDFVVSLLGPKWAPAGPLLCICAVRGIAHTVERTLGWLHVAAGRSDRWMWWGLFSAACQLAALAVGLPFGPVGVTTAYTIAMFALFVPALAHSGRPLGIGGKDVLRAVGPQMVAGLVAVAAGLAVRQYLLDDSSEMKRLLLSSVTSLAIYLVVVVGAFRVTGPLQLAQSMLRDFGAMRARESS
jgi:PST family polysaccharide transporter